MRRVIQWATGAVGRHAAAAVREHADLELVGALVYSDSNDDSAAMMIDITGFGQDPATPVPMSDPALVGGTFRAPLMLLAEGLPMIMGRGVLTAPRGKV